MAITSQMIEQYQHPRIKLVVGSTTIYEDDIVSGSFSYHGGVTGGGAFAPGGCVISSASFTVYNRTGSYTNKFAEGTTVSIYIGYGSTPQSATYDLLCTVKVATATKRTYKIAVSCYDKLRDADKKKWTTYSFPMTVNQIIQSAATEAGIGINQLPTAGGSISVDIRDNDGNQPSLSMTCRQAIAQALLISGNFGYMTPSGQLYCGWFPSSVSSVIPNSWIMDYSVTDTQDYTGVQVYGQTPTGTNTRLYVLSSGRFITEDNCAAIQSRLAAALIGLSVRKGSFSIICNPNVKPGQVVQVTVPQAGSSITMTIPITSVVIKGSLKASYTSEAVSADEADDLRKPDTVTQEDLEKAIEDISGGGGGVLVHFPEVEMQCSDPTHWFAQEAPCSPTGRCATVSYISIGYNRYTQQNVVYPYWSDGGYDFDRIIWYSSDAMIPVYHDPNVPIEFDITLYLYMFDVSVGGVPSFLAEDTVNNQLYLLPVQARAKYYGNDIIYFSQQWVRLPANYSNNIINSEIMIPLPSRRFNIATSQWIVNSTGINGETYYAPLRYL